MASNYINDGKIVHVTLTAPRTSGEFDLIQNQVVVYLSAGEIGDLVAVARAGRFRDAPKHDASDGSQEWEKFQTVYWDDAQKRFTLDAAAGANPAVGIAAQYASDGDVIGEVILQNAVS